MLHPLPCLGVGVLLCVSHCDVISKCTHGTWGPSCGKSLQQVKLPSSYCACHLHCNSSVCVAECVSHIQAGMVTACRSACSAQSKPRRTPAAVSQATLCRWGTSGQPCPKAWSCCRASTQPTSQNRRLIASPPFSPPWGPGAQPQLNVATACGMANLYAWHVLGPCVP